MGKGLSRKVRFGRILIIGTVSAIYALLPLQVAVASIQSPLIGQLLLSTGLNQYGQTGSGDGVFVVDPAKFALPSGVTAAQTVRSLSDTWVRGSDGKVYGVGYNESGELGDGTTTVRNTPVVLQLPGGVTAVSIINQKSDYPQETALHIIGSDGNVYSVGHNQYGEFGDGSAVTPTAPHSTPVKFILPGGVTAAEVETGLGVMYVRGSDGNVYGAGLNTKGQLGDGTTTTTSTPVVMNLPGGVSATDIVTSDYVSAQNVFVMGSDGQVYGVGQNYGLLGDGLNVAYESTPVKFQLPGGLTAVKIQSGDAKITSVIASDGQLYNTGSNYYGQLGDNTTTFSMTPVRFQLPGGVNAVESYTNADMESHHVLGSDGNLYSAGYNDYGRFGTGPGTADNPSSTLTTFPMPGSVKIVNAFVNYQSIIVVGDDGNVYAAGENANGQFGVSNTTTHDTPVQMNLPSANAQKVVATYAQVFVLTSAGTIYSTGDNTYGMSGIGTHTGNLTAPAQMQLPAGFTPTDIIVATENVTYSLNVATIIGSAGDVLSTGFNRYGEAGNGAPTGFALDPVQFKLPVGVNPIEVHQLNDNLFVLGSDNQLYGAGSNRYGQLGDGTFVDRFTPVKFILPGGVSVVKVVAPSSQSIAVLASDGNVYSAGYNPYGTFGNGNSTNQATPVVFQLPGGVLATSLSSTLGGMSGAGLAYNMSVIGSDGNAYTAGTNQYGQLGNGASGFTATPPTLFPLPGGLTALKVYNMSGITAVLASDNNIYMAGYNQYGQLGNGLTATVSSTPTLFQLPGGVTVTGFDGTPYDSYVSGSDGNLYGAGLNTYGQLGDGTTTQQPTPVVFGLPGGVTLRSSTDLVVQVPFSTQTIVTVIGSDNKVYSAGIDPAGDGLIGDQSTPVEVALPGGLTATKLVTSYNPFGSVSIVASDGQLYQAGSNQYGQLGDGTKIDADTVVRFQLPAGVNVTDARPESQATIVLGSDGKVYVAGHDTSGWLSGGANEDKATVTAYSLPTFLSVNSFDAILGRNLAMLTTPVVNAVGGQVYCDGNRNGVQDTGEDMMNGQSVAVYQSVAGVATGPAVATYNTETYATNDGVFFFDGLPDGEYILALTTATGTLYSAPVTINGSGDGWILGSSSYINSASAMGQTGFVCGTSTVVPNVPSGPATPSSLVPTGAKVIVAYLAATAVAAMAIWVSTLRRRFIYQLAR